MLSGKRPPLYGDNAYAWNSREPEILLAGAAGTGKSLAWCSKIRFLVEHFPGARCLIVRKTRESLTESILVTWERDILGAGHPVLLKNPTLRRIRQSYNFANGSTVVVGGMDKPDKVLSSEWDVIYCPEATDLTLVDWETLGGRLRAGAIPFQQLCGCCNPTSPHHWLYQRHLQGLLRLYTSTHQDNPRYWDRKKKEWTEEGKKYLARLQRMTGARRKRFLEGKWAVAEGLVYDYRPEAEYDDAGTLTHPGHLLPAGWKAANLRPEWPRVWSIDWGISAPTVLQMWAVDPAGRMYLYREKFRVQLRPDILGRWAKELMQNGQEPRPRVVVCDHDEKNKAQFEQSSGLGLTLADKADRDRGIETTQERFDLDADGLPRIFFCSDALDGEPDERIVEEGRPASTIAELASYTFDPDMLKDSPIEENDHGCLVAGTMIETNRGPVPIEQIQAGDRVLTRGGYKQVLAAGCTNPAATVQTVYFSGGRSLTGTADHPVWTGTEFVPLGELRDGVRVLLSETTPVFNLTVSGAHEFFANGILVHNCDAMRYSARWVDAAFPKKPLKPNKPKPASNPFSRLPGNTWN